MYIAALPPGEGKVGSGGGHLGRGGGGVRGGGLAPPSPTPAPPPPPSPPGRPTTCFRQLNCSGIRKMKAPSFTALLSPHGQRRRPFPSIGLFWPSPRQSIEGAGGNGRHADHFINQAPPRSPGEGASEPTADSRRPAKRFPRGQSRVPELRGAHAAPRRMRPRPAAPPDAWAGLAAEPAEAADACR